MSEAVTEGKGVGGGESAGQMHWKREQREPLDIFVISFWIISTHIQCAFIAS